MHPLTHRAIGLGYLVPISEVQDLIAWVSFSCLPDMLEQPDIDLGKLDSKIHVFFKYKAWLRTRKCP